MMSDNSIGRELIKLVQIDQDFCNNTYGVAPCTASDVTRFNFNDGSTATIPTAVFSGDFFISGTVTASDLNGLDYVLSRDSGIGHNSIQLAKSTNAPLANFQLILYQDTTEVFAHSFNVLSLDSPIDFEVERVGTSIYFRVTGFPEYVDTIPAGLTFEIDKIGEMSSITNSSWKGQIYNISFTGSNGGDRFYSINDNNTTLIDSISAQNATLTEGTGSWLVGTGTQKCFNTYVTCQDKPNYDKGTKTITFKKNQCGNIEGYAIPSLNNFSVKPLEVNIGSRETRLFNLGSFGSATVTFKDLPFTDNHLDPYVSERTYNPLEQGTFWSKWLARNPYFQNREIRLYEGLVGQSIGDMHERRFLIDKVSNPDANGIVKINCVDLMRKTDAVKIQYPTLSNVQLLSDINSATTTIDTIGQFTEDTGQPTTGVRYFSIGDEIISYDTVTDLGGGVFRYTGGARGALDTENKVHEAFDSCQNVIFTEQGVYYQLLFLLIHTGFELSQLDTAGWQTEIDNWLSQYKTLKRTIMTPTPVNQLIGELARECGFFIWFDEEEYKVKIKAIRPETEEIKKIDSQNNLIQSTTQSQLETNERMSSAFISYNIRNPSFADDRINSYRTTLVRLDPTSTSENEYGEAVTFYTQAKWLYTQSQTSTLMTRLISRYRDNTRYVKFDVDIKDDMQIGSVFSLDYSGFVDIYGNNELILWQVVSKNRINDKISIKAQEFYFAGDFGYYMADDANNYDNATAEEKENGAFYDKEYQYF